VAKSTRRTANANDAESLKPKPSRRESVTLTPFQWSQVDSLEGIYAPTVPEVLKRAVVEWLAIKHDEIEQQKRDYRTFLERAQKESE
jgi:hypothetical protein